MPDTNDLLGEISAQKAMVIAAIRGSHCPSACLHCIGEDVSEQQDIAPAQFRAIITRRPK